MNKTLAYLILLQAFFFSCTKDDSNTAATSEISSCNDIQPATSSELRPYFMGFTSWVYGPDGEDWNSTYDFLQKNGDIYAEQIDHYVPWKAWINQTSLPDPFLQDIAARKSKRSQMDRLVLSVSLLNGNRTGLVPDIDGTIPTHMALSDPTIEDAYYHHLHFLIEELTPNYLIMAMEVNDLLKTSPQKWDEYKALMQNIRNRIKQSHPDILLSESITLHNWYTPDVADPVNYIQEINAYTQLSDFTAVSFYPFFKQLKSSEQFQQAFDFLHQSTSQTIAMVETNHIADTLDIPELNLYIPSDPCQQKEYLHVLAQNAHQKEYEFVIWWAHRDYTALWETLDEKDKPLGKVWLHTGLLEANGTARPAYSYWDYIYKQ